MLKKITEKLVARLKLKFSWEKMVGVDSGIVCNLLILQVLLWSPVTTAALTGALLIVYGTLWVIFGPCLLFFQNRPTSVTIGSGIIVFSGCCMIGLGIAMMLQLTTKMDWMPRMAGIFYALAFFVWLFVILKMAPTITRWLLMGVVCCVVATAYALVCNVLVVINALVTPVSHLTTPAEQAVAYYMSGGAVVGWTLCVMWKGMPTNFKWTVPAFVIMGVVFIGFGIALTVIPIPH